MARDNAKCFIRTINASLDLLAFLILPLNSSYEGTYCFFCHFTDEKIEPWKGYVIPGSHRY